MNGTVPLRSASPARIVATECIANRRDAMDEEAVRAAAKQLADAYTSGTPIAPLVRDHPDADVGDAYRIQREQLHHWCASGAQVKGHKVGLTSAAMQEQMGVDQPDHGHLVDSMFHPEHQPIPTDGYLQPRIEPEVAFVLAHPLSGPGVTAADAIRAVEFCLPALEIVDSRIRDWNISIVDTIADNASSGGVVLGSRPQPLSALDLRQAACTLYSRGEHVATGLGGAVLGSPVNALVWLANTVGPLGIELQPGQVVLPGSMTRAIPVRPGDTIVADVANLGDVTAIFA